MTDARLVPAVIHVGFDRAFSNHRIGRIEISHANIGMLIRSVETLNCIQLASMVK